MEEERFVEEQIENINISETEEIVVPIVDETIVLSAQNDIIETEIQESEVLNIAISEEVGPHALKIVSDHAFGLPRQHSIGAIEGLREELDDIERLTTVYSDSVNQANYYMWKDENPNQENRDGYFVSVHQDDNKIYLCKAADDEFGVTVSSAGFVGNQNADMPRGSNYALVVHSGLVGVRCRTDVVRGDYVVSDDYGMAQKTNGTYGYLVTSISDIDGVRRAIISLTTPTTQMQKFAETTQDVSDRMDSAEVNIATAISVANAAYNKAQVAQNWVQGNVENIAGQVGDIGGIVDEVVVDITKLGNDTVSAKEEALKAQNVASTTLRETQNLNNSMHSNLSSLVKHLDPDSTWTDPETGENWDSYFVNYIENGNIPTSSTIKTLDGRLTQNAAETSHNAAQIQQIVTSTDMYSIGEWSQAYGLNLAEAWNILKVGMVYIPTTALHTEKYGYKTIESWGEDEEEIKKRDINLVYRTKDDGLYWRYLPVAPDGTLIYEWKSIPLKDINDVDYIIDEEEEFTRGYFYTWNGYYWVESDNTPESPVVIFSGAYVDNANGQYLYWYMDTPEDLIVTKNDTDVTYRARSLYKWQSGEWVEVNVLSGNITNRATSSLIQTATEIAANVTNARGWMAHMGVKIDEDGSFVDQVASVVTPLLVGTDKHKVTLENQYILNETPTDSIVGVEGQYYAVGTEQPYDVYIYQDGAWQKKPLLYYDGVYIMKINTSSILLSANEDDAIVSINGPTIFTTDENGGVTGINGSCITTGTIASNDGTVKIDLGRGTAGISGKVTATSGYIGDGQSGFAIGRHLMYKVGEIGLEPGKYYFGVDNEYYEFELDDTLNSGDRIVFSQDSKDIYINNEYRYITTELDEEPLDAIELTSTTDLYYSLSNNQYSLWGTRDRNTEGIYVGPDGIGVGDGALGIRADGYFGTQGKVEIYYVDSNNKETKFFVANPEAGTVLLNGDLTLDGNIVMNGSITWSGGSSPVHVLYCSVIPSSKPSHVWYKDDGDCYYEEHATDWWHTVYQHEEEKVEVSGITVTRKKDYYASYTYDNGVTWTEVVKIRGEDGKDGYDGNDADITQENVFMALTDNGNNQGIFGYQNGDLTDIYINATYIKGGTLTGVTVQSVDEDDNIIELSDGFFNVKPQGETTKLQIGTTYSNNVYNPYILIGSGDGGFETSLLDIPIKSSTGLIYKNANGMMISYAPSDVEKFMAIQFLETGSINFLGNINFSGAKSIDFGDHAPSGGSGEFVAVFG